MLSRYRAWANERKIPGGGAAVLMLTTKDARRQGVQG